MGKKNNILVTFGSRTPYIATKVFFFALLSFFWDRFFDTFGMIIGTRQMCGWFFKSNLFKVHLGFTSVFVRKSRFNMTSRCRYLLSCFCLRLGSQHISRLDEFMFKSKPARQHDEHKKSIQLASFHFNVKIYLRTRLYLLQACKFRCTWFFEYGQIDPKSSAYVGEYCGVGKFCPRSWRTSRTDYGGTYAQKSDR